MNYFIDLLIGGITRGSIYALIALGYTMVYGVLSIINFAHGEIYMIGAFIALIAASLLMSLGLTGWSVFLLSITIAIIYSAMYGWTLEKIAYKPLRDSSRLAPLISAIGMSIFLQNYVRLVQTPNFISFPDLIPDMPFLDSLSINIQKTQVMILVTTFVIMIILTLLIKFSRIGLAMRATSQDKTMAMLSGINVNKVISATFVIGSILAAVAGVLIGAHMEQINFYIGFLAGIKAFTAAVLGGIGSIPGAVLGAMILGLTESFAAGYISSAYEDVFAFGLLILILILKPNGLLGRADMQKV